MGMVAGTRPEIIKLYPIWKQMNLKAIWTNQSPNLKQELIKFDIETTLNELSSVLKKEKPQYVVVQGDTRTAFYGAVKAFELGIPVVHVEAGLRSWDLSQPFPEEGYRRMISEIADVHFCSTLQSANNLQDKRNVYVVGQTGIDTLKEFMPKVSQENFAVVTIHRKEADLSKIIPELKKIQKLISLKIYAHPNEKGQELRKHFNCLDPLPYEKFIGELSRCRLIISDSGGIQEEAPYLNKPLVIARETTERPEVLETGGAILAGYEIFEAVKVVLLNEVKHSFSPFGEGIAAKLIKEILNAHYPRSNK